jgi:hypothetical protein
MHSEIIGESVKHLKKFFNNVKKNHDDTCWAKISNIARKIHKKNNESPPRQFVSEETYFKLTAHDKMKIFRYIDPILDLLKLPDQFKEGVELLKKHSCYFRQMCLFELTNDQLEEMMDTMLDVRRRGFNMYPDNRDEVRYFKGYLTINSHYLLHTPLFTELYGVPRHYWVFAYESLLGNLKQYLERHRNGKSEGN